ncbi:MAG: hypothetical protein M1550_05820 [Deltaproteobacteria bacterium]|nr:hypothetical protein [Deltaproteobacteria bacterium]
MSEDPPPAGTALRHSLWNLLFRIVSSTDHSRTAWTAILRGSCLCFFKSPIDELPLSDNEASRRDFRDCFYALPDHRVYDLYEFLLSDDRAGLKEADRKLIRHNVNRVLDEELAPVRLLRDRFVPLADSAGFDAVAGAEESLSLFGMEAAARHQANAIAFLSRRPEPAAADAVREAVLAVAAVVRTLSGATGPIAVGTVQPVAERLAIGAELSAGVEALLRRAHAASGLPGATPAPVDFAEAKLLVVLCSSLIEFLLARSGREDVPNLKA